MVVLFDPAAFREAYPHFTPDQISDAQLHQAFEVACLLLDNTDDSPVPYDPDSGLVVRRTLLWLLVCHLATQALWPAGAASALSSATQGSVSVSFAAPSSVTRDSLGQTPCGQAFLRAVRRFAPSAFYVPASTPHPWG